MTHNTSDFTSEKNMKKNMISELSKIIKEKNWIEEKRIPQLVKGLKILNVTRDEIKSNGISIEFFE